MMYQGQVVLDPYDHPVRDFPTELPPTLSTEMNGWEIEYYLRQNRAIKAYDLMGKYLCPSRTSMLTHFDSSMPCRLPR